MSFGVGGFDLIDDYRGTKLLGSDRISILNYDEFLLMEHPDD